MVMPYRPCVFRHSQLGIFQCEKHFFQHSDQDTYDSLYEFCLSKIRDQFCPHLDFGFNMEENPPKLYMNCTHTYKAGPLPGNFSICDACDFPDKDSISLG